MHRLILAAMVSVTVLVAPAVSAIGLGDIQVDSALNQPFAARVPLFAVASDEIDSVRVRLADNDDFERMGIERVDYLGNLRFRVEPGAPPRIVIEADRAVREPLLTLLLDVRGVTGRVLREYTVLLDPPAPVVASAARPTPTPPQALPRPAPDATEAPAPPQRTAPTPVMRGEIAESTPAPTRAAPPAPIIAEAAPSTATPARPASSAPAGPTAPPATAAPRASSLYGPVAAQETLWGVATAVRPSPEVSMNQVIYALVTANPNAFHNGRFEGLMRGARLSVPSEAEMRATTPEAAQAAVSAWRRGAAIDGASARAPAPRTATPTPTPTPVPTATPPAPSAPEPEPEPEPSPESEPTAETSDSATGDVSSATTDADVTDTPPTAADNTVDAAAVDDDEAMIGADIDRLPDGELGFVDDPDVDPDFAMEDALTDDEIVVADGPADPAALTDTDTDGPGASAFPLWPLGLLAMLIVLVVALLVARRRQAATATTALAASPIVVSAAGLDRRDDSLGPDSTADAKRQADEAEALFMAAYADEDKNAQDPDESAPAIADVADAADDVTEPPHDDATRVAVADDVDAGQDPLEEAEMHLAYGLYDEALATLDRALSRDPTRGDWHVKRAEVLWAAGRVDAFDEAVDRAAPYLDVAQRETLDRLHDGRLQAEADIDEPGDLPPFPETASPDDAAPSLRTFAEPSVSDTQAPDDATVPVATRTEPDRPEIGDNTLEFSIDDLPPLEPAPESPAAESWQADERDDRLEFDLNLDAPATAAEPTETAEDDSGFDLDLEGFDVDTPKSADPAPPVTSAPDFENLTLEEFSLDSIGDESGSDPESEVLSSGDGASTKLDLARAYVDMGDAEMGRALLGEVLVEGTPEQQAEARTLLSRIG